MLKIKMIVKALEYYGEKKADTEGYPSGEKWWDLAEEIRDLFDIYKLSKEQPESTKQLKVKDVLKTIAKLDEIMETKDVLNMPIYIGDDDELNGIHCAWYGQPIDANCEEDICFVELINERSGNIELEEGKAFLIS